MLWLLLAESPDSRWVNGQMGEFQNRNADKTAVVGGRRRKGIGELPPLWKRAGQVLRLICRRKIQQR